jgi:hypothetical protein
MPRRRHNHGRQRRSADENTDDSARRDSHDNADYSMDDGADSTNGPRRQKLG